MSSVDDRIVNMQFNNKQFTAGAAESQKALEGLDRTIANTGKSGGGLTTMGTAVDGISTKFGALQVAGVAALGTIVSKATSAGLNVLKSLTIDPIVQGFQEYTTNLNSIQTVVANTGEGIDRVNQYMQKLNTYSDQTIYNFSEMAKNIGTFTAAGVDLETATASIQGIANIAALSGSSSQQASTAMYQLSQAIAAGRVGLQDWNSVVNAGMGGKQFQTALANTAVAMGEISQASIGLEGPMQRLTINGNSFRQSISAAQGASSWLSSDVLVNTLAAMDGRFSSIALGMNGYEGAAAKAQIAQARLNLEQKNGVKYTDEQFKALLKMADASFDAATTVKSLPQLLQVVRESIGSIFSNSFQIILGDFEQSKALWGAVGKTLVGRTGAITKIGTAWTTLLRGFVEGGGRTKVLSGLMHIFKNLGRIMMALKGAFQDIFPPSSGRGLVVLAKGLNQFSRYLVLSKSTLADLQTIFAAFFSVLHIGFEILKGVGAFIGAIFKSLASGGDSAGSGILNLVASVASLVTAFDKFITRGGQIPKVMGAAGAAVGAFIGPVVQGIGLLISGISALVTGGGLDAVVGKFSSMEISFSSLQSLILDGWAQVMALFQHSSGSVDGVANSFSGLADKVKSFVQNAPDLSTIFSGAGKAAGNVAGQAVEIGAQVIAGLISGLAAAAPQILSAIGTIVSAIIDGFKSALGIHSPATTMVPVGSNIVAGIAVGIAAALSTIGAVISGAAHFLMDAFKQLFGDMDALDIAALMNSLFSGAFILMITQFGNTIQTSLKDILASGFKETFKQLGDTLKSFQQGIKAKALLDIALAVGVLVASLVVLSLMDPKDIAVGLGAIGAMLAMLVTSLSALNKFGGKGGTDIVTLAASMTLISAAMIQLALAITILGHQDMGTLAKGIGAIALVMGIMVASMAGFAKIKGSVAGMAGSILIISVALTVMAAAVAAFGNMDMGTLAKGFGSIAVGLGLMVLAMLALDKMKSSPEGLAGSILIMAGALVVMAAAVGTLGNMDMGTLVKGMGAMAVGLVLMVGALLVLGGAGPMVLAAAQAMAIMSLALIGFATAVGMLGSMDMGTLAKGIGAIAIAFAILLAAAAVATYVAPGLIVLGVAVGLIGAGMFLAGAGILAFSTGLAVLATLGTAAFAVITLAIMTFVALLPTIAIQVAASFVTFIETIAKAAPRVRAAFSTIFREMLGVITDAVPQIAKLFQALITAGIGVLTKSIPQWINMGMTIIEGFLEGLAKRIPKIADAALDMIQQLLETIASHIQPIISAGTDIIVSFLEGMGKSAGRIAKATGQMILDVLNGIDAAVQQYSQQITEAGIRIAGHLISGIVSGITSSLGSALNNAVGGVTSALGFGKRAPVDHFGAAKNAVNAAAALVSANLSEGDSTVAAAQADVLSSAAEAERKRIAAALAQQDANKKAQIANKKKATKAQKDAARAAQKKADRLAADSQAAQNKSSKAVDALGTAIDFRDADTQGKGDVRSQQAQDLLDQANVLSVKAARERAAAKDVKNKKERAKMLADAQALADKAKALADQAAGYQRDANALYATAVQDRINALNATIAADAQARADAAAYEAADQAGKAKIMQDRAAASQAAADTAKAQAAALIQQAQALASTNAAEAMRLLDEAEAQAAKAKEAADQAEQQRQEAEQLLNQPGSTTSSGSGSTISPSKSVLEDAAKAVDRYTASLVQAQEAAGSTQTVVQYNQNVYSPTALSPAEVYRQSKNLLSAQEVKMGENISLTSPLQTTN